jgi:hypothetical protein
MFRLLICFLVLAGLTGCATSPQGLGLTGAPQQTPPVPPDDNALTAPGVPQLNSPYSSSTQPTTGGGRFYGY